MSRVWIVVVAACLLGCPPSPCPPQGGGDAGDDAPDTPGQEEATLACHKMCGHWADMKCPQAYLQIPGRCVDSCINTTSSGLVHWNLACREKVTTCAAIDQCERP